MDKGKIIKVLDRVKDLILNIRKYPLEAALCLTYFIIFVLMRRGNLLDGVKAYIFIWFVPQLVLCYTLHQFKERHIVLKILYILSWFVWIPLIIWGKEPYEWNAAIIYLLSAIAFLIGTKKMDNRELGEHMFSVVIRMAGGLMVGLLLEGVIYAVIGSVDMLFDLSLDEEWYIYPSIFNCLVITPLVCFSLLDGSSSDDSAKGGRLLQIVFDYILSSALVIYAVILYGYIIHILIKWELPEGGVAYLVLAFLCVAMVCYLFRLLVEKRHFEWFYRAFPAIAVPPLVLLWIGIFRRVGEYGLTDTRFYLLLLATLVTLFIAMLVKERSRRFQLMALIMAAAAVLFTFIPGVRAKDFGIRSQMSRLDKELPVVLEDGHFPVIEDYSELQKDTARVDAINRSHSAWKYLKEKMSPASFEKKYGAYGDFDYSPWMFPAGNFIKDDKISCRIWELSDMKEGLDLGPYTILVSEFETGENSSGVTFVKGQSTLIFCPVTERLDNSDEITLAEKILVYENDRYKAVIGKVYEYYDVETGKRTSFTTSSQYYLFKKP